MNDIGLAIEWTDHDKEGIVDSDDIPVPCASSESAMTLNIPAMLDRVVVVNTTIVAMLDSMEKRCTLLLDVFKRLGSSATAKDSKPINNFMKCMSEALHKFQSHAESLRSWPKLIDTICSVACHEGEPAQEMLFAVDVWVSRKPELRPTRKHPQL